MCTAPGGNVGGPLRSEQTLPIREARCQGWVLASGGQRRGCMELLLHPPRTKRENTTKLG
eukprot:8424949-Ditylum_brightwellii.AAC.1